MRLVWLAGVFVILFVGQTINRLPRDVLTLKEHYQMKDWSEFYAHLAVCGFFWLGSTLAVIYFFLPFLGVQFTGWSKIWDIVSGLGR
ncbi:MAG: hypothetical protein JXR73_22420 [Candidatus Omnitrophica bacterium]|nr:hypothetical protein [Candidatus Omnitrophota bacterium]